MRPHFHMPRFIQPVTPTWPLATRVEPRRCWRWPSTLRSANTVRGTTTKTKITTSRHWMRVITMDWVRVGVGMSWDPRRLAVDLAEHDVQGADGRDNVSDQASLGHLGQGLEVDEPRSPHVEPVGVQRALLAHEVVADLALGRFGGVVDLVDLGPQDLGELRHDGPFGHAVHALLDDAGALAHLRHAHLVPRVGIRL